MSQKLKDKVNVSKEGKKVVVRLGQLTVELVWVKSYRRDVLTKEQIDAGETPDCYCLRLCAVKLKGKKSFVCDTGTCRMFLYYDDVAQIWRWLTLRAPKNDKMVKRGVYDGYLFLCGGEPWFHWNEPRDGELEKITEDEMINRLKEKVGNPDADIEIVSGHEHFLERSPRVNSTQPTSAQPSHPAQPSSHAQPSSMGLPVGGLPWSRPSSSFSNSVNSSVSTSNHHSQDQSGGYASPSPPFSQWLDDTQFAKNLSEKDRFSRALYDSYPNPLPDPRYPDTHPVNRSVYGGTEHQTGGTSGGSSDSERLPPRPGNIDVDSSPPQPRPRTLPQRGGVSNQRPEQGAQNRAPRRNVSVSFVPPPSAGINDQRLRSSGGNLSSGFVPSPFGGVQQPLPAPPVTMNPYAFNPYIFQQFNPYFHPFLPPNLNITGSKRDRWEDFHALQPGRKRLNCCDPIQVNTNPMNPSHLLPMDVTPRPRTMLNVEVSSYCYLNPVYFKEYQMEDTPHNRTEWEAWNEWMDGKSTARVYDSYLTQYWRPYHESAIFRLNDNVNQSFSVSNIEWTKYVTQQKPYTGSTFRQIGCSYSYGGKRRGLDRDKVDKDAKTARASIRLKEQIRNDEVIEEKGQLYQRALIWSVKRFAHLLASYLTLANSVKERREGVHVFQRKVIRTCAGCTMQCAYFSRLHTVIWALEKNCENFTDEFFTEYDLGLKLVKWKNSKQGDEILHVYTKNPYNDNLSIVDPLRKIFHNFPDSKYIMKNLRTCNIRDEPINVSSLSRDVSAMQRACLEAAEEADVRPQPGEKLTWKTYNHKRTAITIAEASGEFEKSFLDRLITWKQKNRNPLVDLYTHMNPKKVAKVADFWHRFLRDNLPGGVKLDKKKALALFKKYSK